ncbi:hypothetical protein PR048_025952 [Dryococelus australis]|uniref:Uncharacterized protein n=1 Tax=Dryococelus australis TaxID=614101 RepID=A0ABQ9GK15_9NEOP|nr:hypothetical protein PR048_025952 [Dryococelus australis]
MSISTAHWLSAVSVEGDNWTPFSRRCQTPWGPMAKFCPIHPYHRSHVRTENRTIAAASHSKGLSSDRGNGGSGRHLVPDAEGPAPRTACCEDHQPGAMVRHPRRPPLREPHRGRQRSFKGDYTSPIGRLKARETSGQAKVTEDGWGGGVSVVTAAQPPEANCEAENVTGPVGLAATDSPAMTHGSSPLPPPLGIVQSAGGDVEAVKIFTRHTSIPSHETPALRTALRVHYKPALLSFAMIFRSVPRLTRNCNSRHTLDLILFIAGCKPQHLHSQFFRKHVSPPPPPSRQGPRWLSGQPARPPPRRSGPNPRPGQSGFSQVGIVPDDAVGRRVFSGNSRFPPPSHSDAAPRSPQSPSSALKTSMLRAVQKYLPFASPLPTLPQERIIIENTEEKKRLIPRTPVAHASKMASLASNVSERSSPTSV